MYPAPQHNYDLTKEKDVKAFMLESKSGGEWDARFDHVKAANGGQPPIWWVKIILSPEVETLFNRISNP